MNTNEEQIEGEGERNKHPQSLSICVVAVTNPQHLDNSIDGAIDTVYPNKGNSSELMSHDSTPNSPKGFLGSRHIFAFMGFLGLASIYMMRVNLSVAIVDMVIKEPMNNASSFFGRTITEAVRNSSDGQCEEDGSNSFQNTGEFDWDGETQALVLGAFFWGFMITQIPGGILAEKYGGKLIFGVGVFFTVIFCMLTPLAARCGGPGAIIAVRVLTGLAEGVTFPTANSMIAKWVPTFERTTIGAFVLAGTQFGTVISLPLSGILCELELDNGWPLSFYVPGIFGIVWLIGWIFLVFDSPDVHPRIAEDEKRYIIASTGVLKPKKFSETPWSAIFASVYFWAIMVAHLGHNWGFCMLLSELPTYMDTVLHFNLKANGFLSALPYLAMWLFSIAFSVTADALRKNNIFSTTATRKIFTTIGLMLPALGLIGASYTGCDRVATLTFLTLSCGFNGAVYSGFLVNHIDIASNYAGTLMGITNCAANICGFLAPYIVNLIVTTPGDVNQWQTVFFISAGIYASTCLFYTIFGTGVEQLWNKPDKGKSSIHQKRNSSTHSPPNPSSAEPVSK